MKTHVGQTRARALGRLVRSWVCEGWEYPVEQNDGRITTTGDFGIWNWT
jgi:hypothetical protein